MNDLPWCNQKSSKSTSPEYGHHLVRPWFGERVSCQGQYSLMFREKKALLLPYSVPSQNPKTQQNSDFIAGEIGFLAYPTL